VRQTGSIGQDEGSAGSGPARARIGRCGQDLESAGPRPAGNRTGRSDQGVGSAGARPTGIPVGRSGQELGSANAGPKGSRSLYETLGVAPDATVDEIRSAYRQLALRYHPDKNPGDDGQRFVAVAQAFEVLSDDARRARYDRSGDENLNQLDVVSAEELMEALFAQSKKTPDSLSILSITHQEAQKGATKMVRIKRMVVDEHGGQRQEELQVPVTVPAGCQNKHRITLRRLSNEEPDKIPGDYTFVIKVSGAFEQPASGNDSRNAALHPRAVERHGAAAGNGARATVQGAGPLSRGSAIPGDIARHQSTAEQHGPTVCGGMRASGQIEGRMNHVGRCGLDSGTPCAVAGQSSPYGHGVAPPETPILSECDEAAWNSAF